MRLLHVIPSVDPKSGGPIEGIKQRGLYLKDQGYQVEILSLDDPHANFVKKFPLLVHAVGPSKRNYSYTPKLRPWLRQHANSFDHIIISGLWQYHGYGTASTLRKLGVPYYIFTHGMLDPWFKKEYPLKHVKKWFYWLLAERGVIRDARKVLFTSEEEMIRARESFTSYKANEQVVPYGTTPPPQNKMRYRSMFIEQHPQLAKCHLILYLSRIHEKKGCDLLIDAYAEVAHVYPSTHLLIAGTGQQQTIDILKKRATDAGIADRITWLGMVQGEGKWLAFHASQVFILPSHQENFGIAVAEALGCSVPVLISDKINIWREVKRDGAGLVAEDTVKGTVKNLTEWLNLELADQQMMSEAAGKCFESRYSIRAMAEGLIDAL